jgi:hypothetical protein
MKEQFAKLIDAFIALLKVKTIVTLLIVYAVLRLAFSGVITGVDIMQLAMIIIAFYFGQQSEKGKGA